MKRRAFLAASAIAPLLPQLAHAQATTPLAELLDSVTKGAPAQKGRVKLELPLLADNGNSVPLKVAVESPMTTADYVKAIHLVSERNPVRNMATFRLGPRAGRAEVSSRVRLAGSQRVVAVAEMADGSYWYDVTSVVVTLSACMDES
jgi:sulfur-oxidizing protein SoxY